MDGINADTDTIRRHLIVTGKVQGVFYRAWFSKRATALGLSGWVRNRADGSVEAIVQGHPDAVANMIEEAHRGSPASRVIGIAEQDEPVATLDGFETRQTD